jgi:hypothetical protein
MSTKFKNTRKEVAPREVDTSIKIGDYVRSYDFEYSDDCYYDGVVTGLADYNYEISIIKKMFRGVDKTVEYIKSVKTPIITAPVNGMEMMWSDGLTCGVQKI